MLHILIKRFHISAKKSAEKTPNRFKLDELKTFQKQKHQIQNFIDLKLNSKIIEGLESMQIQKPTLAQKIIIPEIMKKKNILCAAETGSGKTVSYLAPVMHQLKYEEEELGLLRLNAKPRALILLPTKDLVQQKTAKHLSHFAKLRVEQILDREPKLDEHFQGPFDIVISTPKKLEYYYQNNIFSFQDIQYVIIDESDTLLEKDFGELIRKWLEKFKQNDNCQFIFVSATIPKSLSNFLNEEFGKQIIKVASPRLHKTVPGLKQRFIQLQGYGDSKQKTLLQVLREVPPSQEPTLVFCNQVGSVRVLDGWLSAHPEVMGLTGGENKIGTLHSRMTRQERQETIEKFQKGDLNLLIATDIVSRGVDTTRAKHVIQYDFPYSVIDYLHRVGRTARAGGEGKATALVAKKDKSLFQYIEQKLQKKRLRND